MKRVFALILAAAMTCSLAACGKDNNPGNGTNPAPGNNSSVQSGLDKPQTLRVGTTSVGGTYNLCASAWMPCVTADYPNLNFDIQVTGGSVGNMQLFGSGELDLPMCLALTMVEAEQGGTTSFPDPVQVQALTAIFPGVFHIIAAEGSGINTVEDLKGKNVSLAEVGHSTYDVALALFDVLGWDINTDVNGSRLNLTDSVDALADGRIDAMVYQGGVPVPSLQEACTTAGSGHIVEIPLDLAEKIQEKYPAFAPITLEAGVYGNASEISGIGCWNYLCCSTDFDEEVAYAIVKGIWDNNDQWKDNVGCLKTLTPELACSNCPSEFNPGAIRYYKEIGAWQG